MRALGRQANKRKQIETKDMNTQLSCLGIPFETKTKTKGWTVYPISHLIKGLLRNLLSLKKAFSAKMTRFVAKMTHFRLKKK